MPKTSDHRGRGRPWSLEDDARLRELYPCTRMDALPGLLGRSHSAIKNRSAALHLRKNADVSMRRPWTAADDARLRAMYADAPTRDMVRTLKRTLSSTYGRARKLGLAKSEAYLASPAACRLRRGDLGGGLCKGGRARSKKNKRAGLERGRAQQIVLGHRTPSLVPR